MDNIQAKLSFLKDNLVKPSHELTEVGRKIYLDTLREVVQTARVLERELDKPITGGNDDDDGTVLQMRGYFRFSEDGDIIIPTKEEIQEGFMMVGQQDTALPQVSVVSVFFENNFNRSTYAREVDVFVRFGTKEQALYAFELRHIDIYQHNPSPSECRYDFLLPVGNAATRAGYRDIIWISQCRREVDYKLKRLGAVQGRGGIPVLPDKFIQKEEFDATLQAIIMSDADQRRGVNAPTAKENLHSYLVSRVRVDRKKRQDELDKLVDERISLLLRLASYDPDEYSFTYDGEFIP